MNINLDDMKRELEKLRVIHAQELLNAEEGERQLHEFQEMVEATQAENRHIESVSNANLHQLMVLSQSNTAGQVLDSFTKMNAILVEHHRIMKDLGDELKETLSVLVGIGAEKHGHVRDKIQELEKLACERETELQRLKDERRTICDAMDRSEKENQIEIDALMELHTKMMEKKYGPFNDSSNSCDA